MSDRKVKRIPVSWKQRWRNRMGETMVQCQVSNRWLKFPETSGQSGEEWMIVDVMTLDANEEPKKLCELVIVLEDLEHALKHVAHSTKH